MVAVQETQSREGVISEMIGRTVYTKPAWKSAYHRSTDATVTDYEFYDSLRRGKADGYELGGLLAKPLAQIVTSFTLGLGFKDVRLVEKPADPDNPNDPIVYTNQLLSRFFSRVLARLIMAHDDMLALGDQFGVVNPDSSLSWPSPETVDLTHDDLDYRRIRAMTITTRLEKATVTDQYRDDGRTVSVDWKYARGQTRRPLEVVEYQNLIGRLPFVHFANEKGGNELYGRSIYEPILPLFSRYDDVISKMLDGVELMGNPIPVFAKTGDPNKTLEALKSIDDTTYSDADGNTETRYFINFDRLPFIILGEQGEFYYAAPNNGFTNDAAQALKIMFLLLLEHTRIPEGVWGGELGSARSTFIEQMSPFRAFIKWRRMLFLGEGTDDMLGFEANGGLYELADIWLRMRALVDRRIVVGPVAIEFPELSEQDAKLMFDKIVWAHAQNLVRDVAALKAVGIMDGEKAEDEVEMAREEADAQQQDDFERRLQQAEAEAGEQAARVERLGEAPTAASASNGNGTRERAEALN